MTADHANSRIESCAQVLFKAATEAKMPVTADLRIDLADAAKLLGIAPRYMRNLANDGTGPRVYRLGNRGRLTVGLLDLAMWRESRSR